MLGIPFDKQNVAFGDYRFHSGRQAIRQLLRQNPSITAVFVSSDEMALGAISEAARMGIKIPDELSIIGYDNVKLAEMSIPALTTVGQPLFEMGYKSVEMLFDLIEQSKQAETIVRKGKTVYVPHQIVERESVTWVK
jgi:LacI family transcriptional regulator